MFKPSMEDRLLLVLKGGGPEHKDGSVGVGSGNYTRAQEQEIFKPYLKQAWVKTHAREGAAKEWQASRGRSHHLIGYTPHEETYKEDTKQFDKMEHKHGMQFVIGEMLGRFATREIAHSVLARSVKYGEQASVGDEFGRGGNKFTVKVHEMCAALDLAKKYGFKFPDER